MRKIRHLYMQTFMTISVILLISFMILGIAFTSLSYSFLMSERRDALYKTAEEVERMTSAYTSEWEISGLELRMVISGMSYASGYHIMLCNPSGVIVSCSDTKMNCDHMRKTVPDTVLIAAESGYGFARITDLNGIFSGRRYTVALPLRSDLNDEIIGYVLLSSAPSSMAELWLQFAKMFVVIALIVLSLAFILSLITSKKQTKPINAMANAAHRFARGDFSVRIEDTGRADEIGELTDAFNAMADSLERSENLRREFIANVSHELKTPMTTITGFADGIIDGTIPYEKQNDYLKIISSETRRLSRLVRNMLQMSQLQSADASVIAKSSFDITEVVRLSLLSLESKISSRGLDVEAQIPEEAIITRGDKDAITQVVYNLIDNASKFAKEGSVIKIDIWKQEGKAYVSVEDEGETIPENELPMIFDRFHKTDKSRSMDKDGVGLGLYIVKSILDNHNEDIFVTSRDGVTKFIFTLTLWKN